MSDDDIGFDTAFLTLPLFSFTLPIPPFSTSDNPVSPTALSGTPTGIPISTPPSDASFDAIQTPTPTQTGDPTRTDAFLPITRTLNTLTFDFGDPISLPFTLTDIPSPTTLPTGLSSVPTSDLDSTITIDPSTSFSSSISMSVPGSSTSRPTSSGLSSTSGTSFTTSGSSLTSSLSSTFSSSTLVSSSGSSSTTSTSSTTSLSQTSSSATFPPPVTTTTFPTFDIPGHLQSQGRVSSGRTGMIVAATTGAIVSAIVVALLVILCRKRYLKKVRRRATLDPFLGLDGVDGEDGEMVAVSQPLIIGDGPGPGAVAYSDPFTDDSRLRTQSRSLSPANGPGGVVGGSGSGGGGRAVVNPDITPTPDLRGGLAAEYYNQHQSIDRLLAPPSQPAETARSRSPQSLPQVKTQFPPKIPVPRLRSPPPGVGAAAYIHYVDLANSSPLSPGHYSPGNADDQRLTSAFSVASELSPQYSIHAPPPNIDVTLRDTPDPIRASYQQSFDRRQSFTPSVSGPAYEPGDTAVIAPTDSPTKTPPSPGSEYSLTPQTAQDVNFGSRPSPIAEVDEMLAHSQDGSGESATWTSTKSGDTLRSFPVVMTAERVQITPKPLSLTSPSTYTITPGLSTNNFSQLPPPPDGPPPLPLLPYVKPLNLGKKGSLQGPA